MKYNIIIEYFDEQYRVSTDDDITLKQLRDELVISGLDAESSKIYFNGKLLIGCDKLSQYGIKNNDKLVIITIKKNNVKSFVEFVKVKTDVEKKEEKKEEPEKIEEKYKAKIRIIVPVRQPTPDSDSDELEEDDEEEIDEIEKEEKKPVPIPVRYVPIPVKDDSDDEDIVFTQEQEDDLSKVMAFCDVELDEAKKTYLLCRKNLDFTVNTLLDKKLKK